MNQPPATEPLSDERLVEIRAAVAGYRGTSLVRLRPGSAHAHREALLAELDQARAELEQLRAGLRDEWGVKNATSGRVFGVGHEVVAHDLAASYSRAFESQPHHAVTRLVGQWRDADATEATDRTCAPAAPEAPLAASEPTWASVDGNTSSITPAGQTEPTHDGNHPGGYGPTQHKGLRENCPAPDCLDKS